MTAVGVLLVLAWGITPWLVLGYGLRLGLGFARSWMCSLFGPFGFMLVTRLARRRRR